MRIKQINQDMRLLFMLRNPIERAWSAIRYNVSIGKIDISLDASDDIISVLQKPAMVLRGDYEQTLDAYLTHFDSRQILIGFYEAISKDPGGLLTGIFEFLGVSAMEQEGALYQQRFNVSPQHPMPRKVEHFLLERYAPMMRRMAARLGGYATLWEYAQGDTTATAGREEQANWLPPLVHP